MKTSSTRRQAGLNPWSTYAPGASLSSGYPACGAPIGGNVVRAPERSLSQAVHSDQQTVLALRLCQEPIRIVIMAVHLIGSDPIATPNVTARSQSSMKFRQPLKD